MRPAKLYRVGDLIITIKEAADLLDMKEDTLRKKLKRGKRLDELLEPYLVKLGVNNSHLPDVED